MCLAPGLGVKVRCLLGCLPLRYEGGLPFGSWESMRNVGYLAFVRVLDSKESLQWSRFLYLWIEEK